MSCMALRKITGFSNYLTNLCRFLASVYIPKFPHYFFSDNISSLSQMFLLQQKVRLILSGFGEFHNKLLENMGEKSII